MHVIMFADVLERNIIHVTTDFMKNITICLKKEYKSKEPVCANRCN